MNRLHPTELRSLQVTVFAMIVGVSMFLGIGLYLRTLGTRGDMGPLVYISVLIALGAPVLAAFVRNQLAVPPSGGEPLPVKKARAAVIVPLSILEAAMFLCAVAFVLTPSYWPLIASAVPLGTMLAWFPRTG